MFIVRKETVHVAVSPILKTAKDELRMKVYCVTDKAMMEQAQGAEAVSVTRTLLTLQMLSGGIWQNPITRSANQQEYKLALTSLLSLECDDAIHAIVVLDWRGGKLITKGFTWLWILEDTRMLCSYAQTPSGKRCRSFLDTVVVGKRVQTVPESLEDWTALFAQDIQDVLRSKAA
jgi:hypothetical protein